MTSAEPTQNLRKYTVRLEPNVVEGLKQFYPHAGYNHVLRALTRRHLAELQQRVDKILSERELNAGEQ